MLAAGAAAALAVAASDASAAPADRAAAASHAAITGVWVSRNKALPDGTAAGFPLDLSSTDWIPVSGGSVETRPIETYEHQKAAVEKVIANNGDVFAYERSRHAPPPYSAAGQKAVQQAAAARAASPQQRNPYDQCLPRNAIGFSAGGGFGGAMELFIAADHIGAVSENGEYRIIHTGQVDPSKYTPAYAGVSVGHWEGDRLVVVTTNYLGETAGAWPMSDKAKVTDTLWVAPNGRTLNVKTVYEDPVNLKEPVARMTYADRGAANYEFLPTSCVETVQGAAEYAATFGATPPK
jgi:hypothetical protein